MGNSPCLLDTARATRRHIISLNLHRILHWVFIPFLHNLACKPGVVLTEHAVGWVAPVVWLLAFSNPVTGLLTQATDVECALHGMVVRRGTATTFPGADINHPLAALNWLNVVSLRVLLHTEDPRLIELPLQFLFSCQLDECELDLRANLSGFHRPLGGLKLENCSPGLVADILLKLVHHF